jgi:hypothetical protein
MSDDGGLAFCRQKVIQIGEECFVGSGVRTLGTAGLCFIRHSLCRVDDSSLRGRSSTAKIGRLTLEAAEEGVMEIQG